VAEERKTTVVAVSATREDAYGFVRRLAEDNEFRARLERNPRAVLAESGIEYLLPQGEEELENVVLPPREEVQRLLEELGTPDESGMVNREALGRGCYAMLFAWGFAMPFIAPDGA
jgi:hypothetical protein